ncbi:MAG: HEAT repeat domain-containing protein, partial [Chloroflexi bacterium]|nr:HEAT repeat domain-containing protein [Chloroflexota bacterium]
MSIPEYLEELRDPDRELTAAGLAQLSGLIGGEEAAFHHGWGDIPAARRLEILTRLSDMADDNPEFDFYGIFIDALRDGDAAIRDRAVQGLWETEDRRTIPKLIERLEQDPEDEVRASAAQVLGHFAALADSGKLSSRDTDRVRTALLEALEDDDEPLMVRRRALEAIAVFRDPALRSWIQWGYDHAESLLRQSAIYAMGRTCDPAWLDILIDEMESEDPAMRFEAANAVRDTGEEDALPHLSELVSDLDSQVAMAALQSIAAIGGA